MKRWLEILFFVTLAVGLHVFAFARDPQSGSDAGGSGGEAAISLEGAAPTIVEMVENWEAPPQVQPETPSEIKSPEAQPVAVPPMPQLSLAEVPRAELRVAIAQPEEFEDIQVDTEPPPPPSKPEAKAEPMPDTRPKPRPKEPAPETARKADQASAGQVRQISAGSGGGAQAGSGSAKVATAMPGQTAKLRSLWGAKIRARIERNKRYPRSADGAGNVTVELSVSRDGRMLNYRVTGSSGVPALDQAALGAVARAKRFPKAPKKLAGNSFRFEIVMKLAPR